MTNQPTVSALPKKMPNLMKATYLGPSEEFLWEGRPSGFIFFPRPIFLLFLVMVYNSFVWDSLGRARNAPLAKLLPVPPSFLAPLLSPTTVDSIQVMVGLALLLIAILYLAVKWFERATTVYAVSNTRFIRQKGIISKDFDEIQLRQIRGIEVKQTGFQRILGYGTVQLSAESGTANTLGNEKWDGFPKPARFQTLVEGAQETLGGVTSPRNYQGPSGSKPPARK